MMNQNDLHKFLRHAVIEICDLPDEDIIKLDEEVAKERAKDADR